MLTQEELDRLLEEAQKKEKEAQEQAKQQAKPQQDDISWEDAFKEAAAAGDKAAQKAFTDGRIEDKPKEPPPQKPKKPAKEAQFSEFERKPPYVSDSGQTKPNLDFILEIPLNVSVELGRTKMQIKDLLQLSQGSIVPLDKLAGEPAEIYVNNKLMAKGEIVVINEKFGVRVTEIISPADRVKSLG